MICQLKSHSRSCRAVVFEILRHLWSQVRLGGWHHCVFARLGLVRRIEGREGHMTKKAKVPIIIPTTI